LTGYILSATGDSFRTVTITLWVFIGSGQSVIARVIVLLVAALPPLLLGPIAGVFGDRSSRKGLMVRADVIRGVLSGCLLVSVELHLLPLTYAAVGISSIISVFFNSSSFALVPRLIAKDNLRRANGVIETSSWVVKGFAPALAGLCFVTLGAGFAFGLDAASFFASACLLASVRLATIEEGQPAVRSSESPWLRLRSAITEVKTEALEGFAYIRANRLARAFIITVASPGITSSANSVAIVFLVVETLKSSPAALGVILSVNGIAAAISSVVVTVFASKIDHGRLLVYCCVGFVVSEFGMAIAPSLIFLGLAVLLSAISNAPFNISYDTVLQSSIEIEYLARVDSVDTSLTAFIQVIMTFGAAALIKYVDPRSVFFVAGVLGGVCLLFGARSLLPELHALQSMASPTSEEGEV
jgi:MFS family permease